MTEDRITYHLMTMTEDSGEDKLYPRKENMSQTDLTYKGDNKLSSTYRNSENKYCHKLLNCNLLENKLYTAEGKDVESIRTGSQWRLCKYLYKDYIVIMRYMV